MTLRSLPTETDSPRRTRTRPARSLRLYVLGLVAVIVLAAGANVAYQRSAASSDARRRTEADATLGATIAAQNIASAVARAQSQVAGVASRPGIEQVFTSDSVCLLSIGGAGELTTGHIDIVDHGGTVACSSLPPTPASGYTGAAWLDEALVGPTLVGPIVDARTSNQVVLISSPITGYGSVVVFFDLEALGQGLATTPGGHRDLEFVVTSADNSVVLARSIDPQLWVGAPVLGTPFADATGGGEHRDLDGTPRLYGHATVDTVGWRVLAGANKSQALAAADRLIDRQQAVILITLGLFLIAAFVVYRRIARPIATLSMEVRAARKHGSRAPISVKGPAEVEGLVADFNELIASVNRELDASTRLAALVESSSDAIVGKTLDGTITSWNAGAEQLYGYTPDEIIGRTAAALIPTERAPELDAILQRIRSGEGAAVLETQRIHKNGSILDVSIAMSPIRDASGVVVGSSAVSRDLTERNRAEAERLGALEDRLRQSERLESLGQLTGGVAHDFNNLLAAIMSYAAFVADEIADRPAVLADVEQIQAAAERAARLTKQLLIVGRRGEVQVERLDLNSIVAEITDLLTRTIGEHIELRVEPSSEPTSVRADRGQIEQVLLNLAVNARDAMTDGGTLTLQTRHVDLDDGYALRPAISAGPHVELAVSDTGTGMSAEVIERIFEPFFTTKPTGQGTGLGLATVYNVVAEAGGSMTVHSEEGIGTTFRLYFPATDAPAPEPATVAVPLPRGKGETILVVEDEPAVLELTARILREGGYAVLEASTFDEALSLAAGHDFQLLLTDSVMPHMSGGVLAGRINEVRPGRAVLYMSGYSDGALNSQPLLAERPTVIQKPFDRGTLLEAVVAALVARPPLSATGAAGSRD